MIDNPSVTAIVPTYNRVDYVKECLDSLLAQTYPLAQIIVVDDGSTDGTRNVVQAFGDKVTYIYKKNGGKSSALNIGLQRATSDFVWICDDDDIADPDGLKYLIDTARAHPDADYIYGRFKMFFEDQNGHRRFEDYPFGKRESEANEKINFLEGMFTTQFSMIVNKSVYDALEPFDSSYPRAQDYEMTLRIARVFKAAATDQLIYYYRQHEGTRGQSGAQFAADQNQEKWFAYTQKIFRGVVQTYALEEFTPTFAEDSDAVLKKRAALLQKGIVFANQGLWDIAVKDFERALALSHAALTPQDEELLYGVVHGKLAWFSLLDDPHACNTLKRRNGPFLEALTCPLWWLIKNALKTGSAKDAVRVFEILWLLTGPVGMIQAVFQKIRKKKTNGALSVIDIACASDRNYIPHMCAMLRSLIDHNHDLKILVHALHDNVPEDLQRRVERNCPEVEFHWLTVRDHDVLYFKPLLHISRATYLRLVIPELLDPSVKKILYLDVDMIINGSIKALWETDLHGNLCAAIIDPGVDPKDFACKHDVQGDGLYFNAGVMLMDIALIQESKLMEKSVALLADPNVEYEYGDQDALNIVFWGKWRALSIEWNFQRKFLYDDIARGYAAELKNIHPYIIHFSDQQKPWQAGEWHPYAWLYLRALRRTDFKREVYEKAGMSWLSEGKRRVKYLIKGVLDQQ